METFRFKQFSINQDKAAMKIGTDGVLLGAWVKINNGINSILDIGTGTGLIALQLAQRNDAAPIAIGIIDAIEIESQAFEQAIDNFEQSDWGDRLYCYHTSLQEFSNEIDDTYDLIVSNPPFYNGTYKTPDEKRSLARHNINLTYTDLLAHTAKLLSKDGSCAFIIPFDDEVSFLNLALANNLHPTRITHVRGNKSVSFKRCLLQFSFVASPPEIDELVIEISRHNYTEAYKNLVSGFYLKM